MYLYLFTSMAWKFICTVCSTAKLKFIPIILCGFNRFNPFLSFIIEEKLVFKTDYLLMQVKSIAECILQYF